jgi:hypothetical protein
MWQYATVALLFANAALAQINLYSSVRGRTYSVSVTAKQSAFSSNFGKRWLYQPAVIKPSPATNNQWVLLFVTCVQEHPSCNVESQDLYMSTSSNGLNFSTPTRLFLNNPTGIQDFIAPRAVYANIPGEGWRWLVYVQAKPYGTTRANIAVAKGVSLNSLSWSSTTVIVPNPYNSYTFGAGIGESFQVFNFASYDALSGYNLLALYNNWSYNPNTYSPPIGGGGSMWGSVGSSTTMYFWHGPGGETWSPGVATPLFGDVMLGNTIDATTKGSPSLALHEQCAGDYEPGWGIGLGPDPYPYGAATGYRLPIYNDQIGTYSVHPGATQAGSLASVNISMFRPRMARNSDGFLTPDNPSSYPRVWRTYVYYTPGNINGNGSSCANEYKQIWKTFTQNFGISEVVITEY